MALPGDKASRTQEYELGHTDWELKRLANQALVMEPITRRHFQDAGIEAGMRVLDVGSGAGDVAFLAAELVTTSGEVVGADRSQTAVTTARERARQQRLDSVSFRVGDPTALKFDKSFDAVVGRFVLMYSPDPAAMLKGLARLLRPGGVIVFHEGSLAGVKSFPPAPIYDRCWAMIAETWRRVGTNPNMGLELYAAFLRAGLPTPKMGLQSVIGAASGPHNRIEMVADLVVTMAPVMEQHGVATIAEIDPDTLSRRMLAEAAANGSVLIGPYQIGVWTRV